MNTAPSVKEMTSRSNRRPVVAVARNRLRERLVATACTLAVMLLAEMCATALAPRLPEPREWLLPLLDQHEEQMHGLAAEGEGESVLVIGSSAVGAAVHAADLTDQTGVSSYNLWVAGAPVRSLRALADELGEPVLGPETVIIGLTSRELNDNGQRQQDSYTKLVQSPGWQRVTGREGPLQHLDRFVSRYSELVEHRRDLRDPSVLARDARKRSPEPGEEIGPRGRRLWPDDSLRLTQHHEQQEREALAGYAVGGAETTALHELITDLQDDDVRVILVNLPVLDEEYLELHPRGSDDQVRYESVLREVVADTGAEYLDARAERKWAPSEFLDENHLNAVGAAALTDLVAQVVSRQPAKVAS